MARRRPLMKIKWSRMYWIIIFCMLFHLLGSFVGLCVLYTAIYITHSLGQHLNIVTSPGEGVILPVILITIGSMAFLLHFPQSILVMRSMQHRNQTTVNRCLSCLLWFHFFWSLIVMIVAAAIVIHSYNIHDRMTDGLLEAMNNYKNSSEAKTMIDDVQFQFQCCGSQSYKDWFNIKWFNDNLFNLTKSKHSLDIYDHVPFSCCSVRNLAPCIHHGVTGGRKQVDYVYTPDRNLSISTDGCHEALAKRAKTLAWLVAMAIAIYSIFQIFTCLLTRLVQTGHSSAGRFNRRDPATCWFIGTSSCKKKQENKDRKKKNKQVTQLVETTKLKSDSNTNPTDSEK